MANPPPIWCCSRCNILAFQRHSVWLWAIRCYDIEMGQRACADTSCAVTYGNQSADELRRLEPGLRGGVLLLTPSIAANLSGGSESQVTDACFLCCSSANRSFSPCASRCRDDGILVDVNDRAHPPAQYGLSTIFFDQLTELSKIDRLYAHRYLSGLAEE